MGQVSGSPDTQAYNVPQSQLSKEHSHLPARAQGHVGSQTSGGEQGEFSLEELSRTVCKF